jgi:transcriptional regulator with XRE-family HTH domain
MKGTIVQFRDNLLYLRQQRNMTQEQLAMLLGVSRQSVAKWEAGQSTPEVDKLMKMAELFGCSLDELVNGDVSQRAVAPEEVLPPSTAAQDVCGYDEHTRRFAKHIALGVMAIILGVAATVLIDAVLAGSELEDLCAIGVLTGVVVGLAFIIPASLEHAAFTKAHPFVEDFYTEAQKDQARSLMSRSLVLGIGLIIVGIVEVIIADVINGGDEAVGQGIMLVMIAVGVGAIVHGGMRYGFSDVASYNGERSDEQWARENPRVGRICGIIMLVATIAGLLALFGGMAMAEQHGSTPAMMNYFWVSWIVGGILCAIVIEAMKAKAGK